MAARIAGVTLPNSKRIEVALTYIYGIGRHRSRSILMQTKINPGSKTSELTEQQINELRETIEKQFKVEGELRREVQANIKRLQDVSSYRGIRHQRGLPSRGQRTKTNSRTVRGNVRKTMGSGRRPSAEKT